jgi:Ca2+-binding RTX toxin-like protein
MDRVRGIGRKLLPALLGFTLVAPMGLAAAGSTANCHWVKGTDRGEYLPGTPGCDVIYAGGGNDGVSGLRGADYLYGQRGWDSLTGGKGDDVLVGGPGKDTIIGGRGADVIRGGPGYDRCKIDHRDLVVRGCEYITYGSLGE